MEGSLQLLVLVTIFKPDPYRKKSTCLLTIRTVSSKPAKLKKRPSPMVERVDCPRNSLDFAVPLFFLQTLLNVCFHYDILSYILHNASLCRYPIPCLWEKEMWEHFDVAVLYVVQP